MDLQTLLYLLNKEGKSQKPADFLLTKGKDSGLSLDDLLGVKEVFSSPEIGSFNAGGAVMNTIPDKMFVNPNSQRGTREVGAHEAEHVRFNQLLPSQRWRVENPRVDISSLRERANKFPGAITAQVQPENDELLAFLRGKEAMNQADYSGLDPRVQHWVLSNMFHGRDKFLPQHPDGEWQQRASSKPSLLDLFRRKMRAFTAY